MTIPAPLHPFDLFRSGHDTAEIARIAGISEAEAYNRMARERERRRERAQKREANRKSEAANRVDLWRMRQAAALPSVNRPGVSLPTVSILQEADPRRNDGVNRLPHHLETSSQAQPASKRPEHQRGIPDPSAGPRGLSLGSGA